MPSNAIQKWIVHYYGFRKDNGAWSGPYNYGPLFYTVDARGHKDAKNKFRAQITAKTGKAPPKGAVIYTWPKSGENGKRKQVL